MISCVDRDGGSIPGGEKDHGKIVLMDRGEVKFRRFRSLPFFSSLRSTVKCVTPILKDRENYLCCLFVIRCFGKKGIGGKGSFVDISVR